ncbi:MAG: hypothetical protein ACRDZN_01420 [Acidimicrobiales bacterium]
MAVVAVIAVAGVLAASVAAAWTSPDDRAGSTAPAPDGEADGSPAPGTRGSSTTTPPPATEAELRAAVDDISAVVERERGLAFREAVRVELASEGDFQRRLLEDFDEDADELRDDEAVLKALGLVDPDADLVASMRALLGGSVVGFYDPETRELVVRGTALTPYVRTTIAHELTHALDDQHFDLHRPEYDDADDEISFGFSALAEGNARRVEGAYLDSLSADEQDAAVAEEIALGADLDVGDVPIVLIDLISAPYALGEAFVGSLVDDGGQAGLDAAFTAPPRTSEQVFDPSAYAEGEARVGVPTPTPEPPGEVTDDGVVGQLLILLVLADEIGNDAARTAAEGWGGDRYATWRDGERWCISVAVVGDAAAETAELRAAFADWATARAEGGIDATVDAPAGGAPVTVRSCSG